MTLNQDCLRELGVSTPKIDGYMKSIEPYVFGSKITGAGGGGCVFSLVRDEHIDEVMKISEEHGMKAFPAGFSSRGVRIYEDEI